MFFNRGEFRPRERDGQKLIAHEIAHTLQQNTVRSVRRSPNPTSERSTDTEFDNDAMTRATSLLTAVGSGRQILSVFFDILQEQPPEQVLTEMSIAFIEGLSDDDVVELLATREGRIVARATIGYASRGAYRVTGSILQVHARVKAENASRFADPSGHAPTVTADFSNDPLVVSGSAPALVSTGRGGVSANGLPTSGDSQFEGVTLASPHVRAPSSRVAHSQERSRAGRLAIEDLETSRVRSHQTTGAYFQSAYGAAGIIGGVLSGNLALTAYSVDMFTTGIESVTSGRPIETRTHAVLREGAGVVTSSETADTIATAIEVGGTLAVGIRMGMSSKGTQTTRSSGGATRIGSRTSETTGSLTNLGSRRAVDNVEMFWSLPEGQGMSGAFDHVVNGSVCPSRWAGFLRPKTISRRSSG